MRPVRIQLSRAKGFNLQRASIALNGLSAKAVTRPGKWGNPYKVTAFVAPGAPIDIEDEAVADAADAVVRFRTLLQTRPELASKARGELKGKNLACWCKPGTPCHADVLLAIANDTAPVRIARQ